MVGLFKTLLQSGGSVKLSAWTGRAVILAAAMAVAIAALLNNFFMAYQFKLSVRNG
jgi:hypothetical protein